MQLGDRELAAQVKAGDRDAFNVLIDRLYQRLLNFATHIVHSDADAQDVVQSVFMNIWRKADRWNPQSSIDAYLFRSTANAALNYLRSKRKHEELNVVKDEISSEEFQPDRMVHAVELKRIIQQAVDALPENYRIPFILSRFSGMKYKHIAEVVEISEKAVERRIGRALMHLRTSLEPYVAEN